MIRLSESQGGPHSALTSNGYLGLVECSPRHWVIERTFGWLGRNRRLAKDFERLIETSIAMVVIAIIQLLVRRLANG